jgi:serine/threonine-protein kinase
MTDPNIGRRLADRYQLVELLGQGAMGRVYGAKDVLLGGVSVAVKFLAQTLLNQRMRHRFEREAMTCALLSQRIIHIVRVTDYGVDEDEVPYYVMEYLQGESLNLLINHKILTLPRFLSLTRQICLGLQCAHEGISIDGEICPIIHRDIKPSNILVCQDNSFGELVKILDFGIAKTLQADSDQTNCFMGTLAYSSPEQMEGRELDGRSDIYSLGVMMFQMLTGTMPLRADTHTFGGWYKVHHYQPPRTFADANSKITVPKVLENLVMSCLAKSPSDRPQSISELLKALETLEKRYGPGRKMAKELESILEDKRRKREKPTPSRTPEEICRLASWPSDKPIAEIVFPYSFRTTKEILATLWVMLKKEEIQKRLFCTRYNQFLFLPAPHPTVLWITVLYNRVHGPRWLTYYLDLKSLQGQQTARLLGQAKQYRLLFFAKEEPQRCVDIQLLAIAPAQCRMLLEWATIAQMSPPTHNFSLSKSQLKAELEKLKPQIEMKLESLYRDESDLAG